MSNLFDLKIDGPQSRPRARCRVGRSQKQDYADLQESQPGESPVSGRPPTPPMTVPTLMRKIEAALASDPDDAVECIYTEVDALLRAEMFTRVDELLGGIDTSALPVIPMLAFVSISYAPRDHLSARPGFVARVRERLSVVAPDRIEELLAGFE